MHLALEHAPASPPAPAPEIQVDAPRDRALRPAFRDRIEVRWRTDGPTVDAFWLVYGAWVPDPKRDGDIVASGGAPAGDRRHRVVLRDARRVRHVVVTLNPRFGTRGRRAAARVR